MWVSALPFLLLLASSAHALLVAPSSKCAISCGNVLQSTSRTELVCSDNGYASSAGQMFQNCISCEIGSTYVDTATNETDLHWALYNLRYTLSNCLFGYPLNSSSAQLSSSPCLTSFACGGLIDAFENSLSSTSPNTDTFNYCNIWDTTLPTKCQSCLSQLGNENYLSNFIIALQAGCIQTPSPGTALSLQGSLFSTGRVNITTPSPPQPTLPSSLTPAASLARNTIVGIAVGSTIGALITAGIIIICVGKSRRKKELARKEAAWKAKVNDGADVQDYVPDSATTESHDAGGMEERNFSPYVDQKPDAGVWTNVPAASFEMVSPVGSQREGSHMLGGQQGWRTEPKHAV